MWSLGRCPRVTYREEEAAPLCGLTVLSFCRGCPRDLCPYGAY